MKTNVMKVLAFLLSVLILQGCASLSGGPTMSDEEFLASEEGAKKAYLASLEKRQMAIAPKHQAEFAAGYRVPIGDPGDKTSVSWNKRAKTLTIFQVYNTGFLGNEVTALTTLMADDQGVPLYQVIDGIKRPIFIVNGTPATSEGAGRVVLKVLGGLGSAVLNGAVAAKINADGVCRDCGETNISVVGGNNTNRSNTSMAVDMGCVNCVPPTTP